MGNYEIVLNFDIFLLKLEIWESGVGLQKVRVNE